MEHKRGGFKVEIARSHPKPAPAARKPVSLRIG
jgi:hypothetical protein